MGVEPITLIPKRIAQNSQFFKAIIVDLEKSTALTNASTAARSVLFTGDEENQKKLFEPHLSLCYGNYDEARRAALVEAVGKWPDGAAETKASEVVLMCTTGDTYSCWVEVQGARFPMGSCHTGLHDNDSIVKRPRVAWHGESVLESPEKV